jgi:hypothetical protein
MVLASILSFGSALLGTGILDKATKTDTKNLQATIDIQTQQIQQLNAANGKLRITVYILAAISLFSVVYLIIKRKK